MIVAEVDLQISEVRLPYSNFSFFKSYLLKYGKSSEYNTRCNLKETQKTNAIQKFHYCP